MVNSMFDFSGTEMKQDQTLALQSKILEFIREALIYDKGYVVFEIKNLDAFEFNVYYSDGSKIDAQYDETRDETIDRILYTIDCAGLNKHKGDTRKIDDIIRYLYNYIVGLISASNLHKKCGIRDVSYIFKQVVQ